MHSTMKTPVISRWAAEISDYNLEITFTSGQAFRWQLRDGWWEGVMANRSVRLQVRRNRLVAETLGPVSDWRWLEDYLQVGAPLTGIVSRFPTDAGMTAAVQACRGLRLLRQPPWECLASFILSSTKQIVQIRQIIQNLCERFGTPIAGLPGAPPQYGFPDPRTIAVSSEAALRECKMGFRARYLLGAARIVDQGAIDLPGLKNLDCEGARAELLRLPGVGPKIADCVLLFAYGFYDAFPIDVWVMKALRDLYFKGRPVKLRRLQKFASRYFGPFPGYAQQYLFHYIRTGQGSRLPPAR